MKLLALSILLITSVQNLISSEESPLTPPSEADINKALRLALDHYDDVDFLRKQINLIEENGEKTSKQLTITKMALKAATTQTKNFLQTQVVLKEHIFRPGEDRAPKDQSKL